MPPTLSIVVPCYNEEEALQETERQLSALLIELERTAFDSRSGFPSFRTAVRESFFTERCQPEHVLVAVDGDEIVGTVIAGWDGWRCHLYRLAVAPSRRRQGIGRGLIDAAEERFRALGGARADAMVLDDNADAHGAWSAGGYRRQGEWSRWVKPLPR